MIKDMNKVSVRGQKRVLSVFAILLIFMILLLFRTAWIQIVKGEEYTIKYIRVKILKNVRNRNVKR